MFAGHTVPRAVPGLDHIVALSAGLNSTCAIRSDGHLWCWGSGMCNEMAGVASTGAPQQLSFTPS